MKYVKLLLVQYDNDGEIEAVKLVLTTPSHLFYWGMQDFKVRTPRIHRYFFK